MPHVGYFLERGYPKPLVIGPDAFIPRSDAQDWLIGIEYLRNRASLTEQYFRASLVLPQGVNVSKITLYGYREGGEDGLALDLQRSDHQGEFETLALIIADWTGGYGSKATTTIGGMPIDNVGKSYGLLASINPATDILHSRLTCVVIDWN